MNQLQIKATISDIEPKLDKNSNTFYKLSLSGFPNPLYAFATDYNLAASTLLLLHESPEKLVGKLVLITYEQTTNKENSGYFRKLKALEIL